MRAAVTAVCLILAVAGPVRAGINQPIYVIDSPTAGLLGHGDVQLQGRLGPQSALLAAGRLGIKNVLHVGLAFGMQNVFERGKVQFNDQVGVLIKVRVVQEGAGPAFALGYSSQGTGPYNEQVERYERKSLGFYGVLSKNWDVLLGQLSAHGGMNYSLERTDQDAIDIFAAVDWEPVNGFSLLADWDPGFNDNHIDGQFGAHNTYLDAAARVNYGTHLSIMLIFRDLLGNYEPDPRVWSELEISFWDTF